MNSNLKDDEIHEKVNDYEPLKNIFWTILDTCQIYVLILNLKMQIVLANKTLVKDLGYEKSEDILGKYWTEFLPLEVREPLKIAQSRLVTYEDKRYRELTNEIALASGNTVVKWFNIPLEKMTLSIGLPRLYETIEISEDTIRSYYVDMIEKDRHMIESLKDGLVIGEIHE
jgi:PAS domain-containing protein